MVRQRSPSRKTGMGVAVPLVVAGRAKLAARGDCSEPPVRGAYTWAVVSDVKCLYRRYLGRNRALDLPFTAGVKTPCSARNRRTGELFKLVDGCLPLMPPVRRLLRGRRCRAVVAAHRLFAGCFYEQKDCEPLPSSARDGFGEPSDKRRTLRRLVPPGCHQI